MYTYNTYFESVRELDEFILSKNICDSDGLLIQVFSGVIDKALLEEIGTTLLKKLPSAKIIGATTSGEILDDKVSDNKIVISFSIFENSKLNISYIDNSKIENCFESGKKLAEALYQDDSKVFILFASGLTVNGDVLLKGMQSLNKEVIISGGLAADNGIFIQTFVMCGDKILDNGAVGVSINSDSLIVHNDYSLAWQSIGKGLLVEKAKGNILYQIDGMTPKELYEKYLGIDVDQLMPSSKIGLEFPLIIQKEDDMNVCRAILNVQDDGSFILVGEIAEGDIVKFGVGNKDAIINGSHHLARRRSLQNAQSIFVYSCMARRVFLDSDSAVDIQDLSKIVDVAGFFTYGEFYSSNKEYSLLNQTLTVLSLSESVLESKEINIDSDINLKHQISRHNALSHLVNTTSKELEELNKNLEYKVSEKIKELQELNDTLEKRVDEAVEINRQNEIQLLEQAKKVALGDMIGNIAHQWRQPLTLISTASTGLLFKVDNGFDVPEQEYIDMLTKINDSTQFLSETINTFRDFVKEKKELKKVVLQERIKIILEIVGASLENNYINFTVNITDEPIEIISVVGELDQAIINIIHNARDILLERNIESPWVMLDIIEDEKDITITIEDNGGGIEENILDKIFEPYFTTRHQYQGTGLGLHMTRKIIEDSLKGSLVVKNTSRGAKFFIKISKGEEHQLIDSEKDEGDLFCNW